MYKLKGHELGQMVSILEENRKLPSLFNILFSHFCLLSIGHFCYLFKRSLFSSLFSIVVLVLGMQTLYTIMLLF